MKIVKGNKIYPAITGNDVIVTKGTNALKTVDEALNDQQEEIDKLKSNVKYIYSYGGVGGTGSGSGSSGGGSSTGDPTLYISLDGYQLSNGGSTIILGSPGTYTVEGNVRNSNGATFYLKVACGTSIDYASVNKLNTETNQCKYKDTFTLSSNGEIVVQFYDSDYNIIETIRQNYIVNPHTFSMSFMYKFNNGANTAEFSTNEYFIGNVDKTDPYVDITFKIDVPNVTNVSLSYSVGDTDKSDSESANGQGTHSYGSTTDISDDHFVIELDKLTRDGVKFTNDINTGTYVVTSTLTYYVSTEKVTETLSFEITLIPSSLYINVRNPQGLLYNSLEDLLDAIDDGEDGIPEHYITTGSYASFYCKIYENSITTNKQSYDLTFSAYDEVKDSDSDTYLFEDIPFATETITGVTEQVETPNPISEPFGEPGIKMLVFSTYTRKESISTLKSFVKYIYVKEADSTIKWYPDDILMSNYYFRANKGSDTYSNGFPELSTGVQPFELSVSSNTLTLTDNEWYKSPEAKINTTILSIGIQYSAVNEDGAKIFDVYAPLSAAGGFGSTPDYTLRSNQLFSETSDQKKIRVPYETSYDKTINSQYHLLQIVRHQVGYDNNHNPQYASYLYIDGILESNSPTLLTNRWYIGKIVFNNVNVAYNLIEIENIMTSDINLDGLIYQYNLKYKESMKGEEISDADRVMLEHLNDIKFDGTNVKLSGGSAIVSSIAPYMPIPTMMFKYSTDNPDEFLTALFQGYSNGDTGAFGTRTIDVYWCDGKKSSGTTTLHQLVIPQLNGLIGEWALDLQGTSTMRNRIKNFSLTLNTKNSSTDSKEKLLVSPNYDPNDCHTFLPEQVWTIKADIADSAHANNTAVGRFVNRTCTTFNTGQNHSTGIKSYIKNTLEGFPIMLYFQIGEDVYYLGVYNFNMGRTSYYNLGYNTVEDTKNMVSSITQSTTSDSFYYAVGTCETVSTLAIGEIQDNFAQFDFHQYHDSVLFQDDGSSITKMFGTNSKITGIGETKSAAKSTLSKFVKSVARAGAYCFANIGKTPKSSKAGTLPSEAEGTDCVDRYKYENGESWVPDVAHQFRYNGNNIIWDDQTNLFTFDSVRGNVNNLLQCISDTQFDGTDFEEKSHQLDYTSASEYYTICMAFGLVDSVLKNMNIKSWDGNKCYIAFYDMDCANGENNAGGEDVSYLAATDYWHSDTDQGYVEPVEVNWDYWNESVGKGFDFKSSYLFAIVKYAQALLNNIDDNTITLTHYPQEFWAILRSATGELQSADYFIKNYFISGIGQIPTYMASLNYQVKYLYKGTIIDDDGNESEEKFLANNTAFNGSRIEKVREWLTRRLHFLDAMFNVQGVSVNIYSNINMPIPTNLTDLSKNTDITILTDVFSTQTDSRILSANNALTVNVYAPMNTPFVINRGSSYDMYLLCAGTGVKNPIQVTTQRDVATRFLGSKEFTNLSMVEPFFTSAYQIVSNNLEEINYGGTTIPSKDVTFNIISTSVKSVDMSIPTFSGNLVIDNLGLNGQAIHTLDVHGSGFYGSWTSLKNLQTLNISSVSNTKGTVKIASCPKLTGDKCTISGTSESPTTLYELSMSGVSGNFHLENTAIQYISMTALSENDATFEIVGDASLKELSLQGFSSVRIKGCTNLDKLTITDTEKNKCKTIIIDIDASYDKYTKGDYTPVLTKFNSDTEGVFDFRSYDALTTLGMRCCYAAEVVKMPNHLVSITTFRENVNLEFIDTTGDMSIIELTEDSTFYMCPCYGMRQSWYSSTSLNGKNISTTSGNSYTASTVLTKMCINKNCTSLAHTFDKVYNSLTSKYLKSNYTNEWGQKVRNFKIDRLNARWFINTVVSGGKLADEYIGYSIDDDGIIHDTTNVYDKWDTPNCIKNIVSLQGCFKMQGGISYAGTYGYDGAIPDLSAYTSLTDISYMYNGTDITCITAGLLSLPNSLNTNESEKIIWEQFVKTENVKITKDALKNISYRISDFNSLTFSVYEYNSENKLVLCDTLDITDFLCIKTGTESDDTYSVTITKNDMDVYVEPLKNIVKLSTFSIDASQTVDYRNLFNVCPNISEVTGFLNTDLSKAKIDGMFKNCVNLKSISDSITHIGDVDDLTAVDLYEFFNWGKNTNMTKLFESASYISPGFAIKKTISYENFKKIMECLSDYQNLTNKLNNIFSYCTITGYDNNDEIVLSGDMTNITYIDSLFYKCKGVDSTETEIPLNIKRSFFAHLPNVVSVGNTFAGVHFSSMMTYDFFCKRKDSTSDVWISDGTSYKSVKLNTHTYGGNYKITNMYHTFYDAKFQDCKSWFVPNENGNDALKPKTDTIDGVSETTYYTMESGKYVENTISEPFEITDTKNNFTNYVDSIYIDESKTTINNHSIANDISTYSTKFNYKISDVILKYGDTPLSIFSTYCCLPPDILLGCSNDCNLEGTFASTNIVGVIPQHLLKNCYNATISDMLCNTNILPNVMYHYNKKTSKNNDYLAMIAGIPVDNESVMKTTATDKDEYMLYGTTDTDATVLFRNTDGELRRRYPRCTVDGSDSDSDFDIVEYSKSQFAYVPQGYTTNTNLSKAFTFRYNLPKQVDLNASTLLSEYNIKWSAGSYDSAYSPDETSENHPELWPYYVQYFFFADESLNWAGIKDMSYPFISDSADIKLADKESEKLVRVFSTSEQGTVNVWWSGSAGETRTIVTRSIWHNKTNGYFNSFLNLCGKRNTRTGVLTDNGCILSTSMNNYNYPKLDSFVSGCLLTFLNGKIFDDGVDAGRFTTSNASKVIPFTGFGRNVILPLLQTIPAVEDSDPKVVISFVQQTSLVYEYMFPNKKSEDNYKTRYLKNLADNTEFFKTGTTKYIVRA